jgi:hypothetical protein
MIGNRLARPVGNRALAIALAPYVALQIAVLAVVVAFPSLLWRVPDPPVAAGASAGGLSDEEIREQFEKVMREQNADSAPGKAQGRQE